MLKRKDIKPQMKSDIEINIITYEKLVNTRIIFCKIGRFTYDKER